ncbi:MAG: DUF368 domain-containing protein [Propionibacteriaceae bacterium]
MKQSPGSVLFSALRGAAIGTSEAVPGISGGTVALMVGLYDTMIGGAGHVVSGAKRFVTDVPRGRGTARAREQFAQVKWSVVIPAVIGMGVALLLAVRLVAPLVEEHTQFAYALFFGLVLACLYIPYTAAGSRWRPAHYLIALIAAVAAFFFTGLPQANLPTHPVIIFFAAAVAVCALVLPGVSGSFILLTLGLYAPTLNAVNTGDFGYIGLFMLGAVAGLSLFVRLLQYLLENHHHLTLVVLTGLMAGSLRALWPWQDEERGFVAPTEVPLTVLLAVIGIAIVTASIIWERRATRDQHEVAEDLDAAIVDDATPDAAPEVDRTDVTREQ